MRNLEVIKRICLLVLIIFTSVLASKASVMVNGIAVNPEYAVGGRLNVTNPAAPLNFKFRVNLSRSLVFGSITDYTDGTATITLVTGLNNEIQVSEPVQILNSQWDGPYMTLVNIPATLPANIQSGSMLIKLTHWNSTQNKQETIFVSQQVINIQYTPPARVPVYMWAGIGSGSYKLALTEPTATTVWLNRGIYFYGYKVQIPGTVPIYEFEGNVNNASGQPEFPSFVTFYSSSAQTPMALPGLGSTWTTIPPKVLFYAFPSQAQGTVPVYAYNNENRNFLFIASGELSDAWTMTHIAFYAYPYGS